jgi:hypothetical protein
MELVAHRAGNRAATIGPALAVADTIELDVHALRGHLEVRHSKVVWPFRIYWERGHGLLEDQHPESLASILAAVPVDTGVWIDLKGFTGWLTRRVLRSVGDRRPLTMSCRSWWALRPARNGGVRTYRSVGSRWQLWLALRLRHPDGVVLHERFATPEHLARLRCSHVAVWAVRDHQRAAELRALGMSAMILDDLDLIGALRADR